GTAASLCRDPSFYGYRNDLQRIDGKAVTRAQTLSVEVAISVVLRVGVLLAFVIVSAGGAMYLMRHHADTTAYQHFHGTESDLLRLDSIWDAALALRSDGVIQLGLVVLIATPIARVLMSAIGFAIDGDRLYLAVSSIVLAVLLYSLVHAV